MHQYLKAIGFENIQTRKDLKKLLKEVEENFTHQTIVSYRPGEDFCEFQKEFGQDVGITLCGELDDEEHFEAAYYFPYFEGSGVTTYAEIDVQRKIEKEQYVGLCEDSKIGISLIFHTTEWCGIYAGETGWSCKRCADLSDIFRIGTRWNDPASG